MLLDDIIPWGELISDRCFLQGKTLGEFILQSVTLQDGLKCLEKLEDGPELREEMAWLMSEEDDWPFSFTNLCGSMGIDSQSLRTAILRRRKI